MGTIKYKLQRAAALAQQQTVRRIDQWDTLKIYSLESCMVEAPYGAELRARWSGVDVP